MMGKDAVVYDKEQQQKFAYRRTLWVGYEDPDTIAKKVRTVTRQFQYTMIPKFKWSYLFVNLDNIL